MTDRNALRAAIFAAKNKQVKSKVITLFDQEVEIRQPTVGQVTRMADRKDKISAIVAVMIEYCFVPGTEEKVFEPSDKDQLLDMPTGQWLTDMNAAIEELTGVNVKATEKNSEETSSDSQS
jgi:hypothetical protein